MAEKGIRKIRKRCAISKGRVELNDGVLNKCRRGETKGKTLV
jgi:hypothetical protein